MNFVEIMMDYLKQYPPTENLLKLNCIDTKSGEISVNTLSSEKTLLEYTNGDKIKSYTFAIAMIKPHDNNGYSNINITELYDAQKFINWIKEQNKIGNLPNIPNIISIKPLQNIPNLTNTNKNNTAKYMFSCEIEYLENMEV